MDKLTLYEASDIVKNLEYVDRTDRELKRYQLYVAIQSNSKNKIALQDVLSLPWDKMNEEPYEELNEDKINEMKAKDDAMLALLNSGKLQKTEAKF